MKTQIWPAIAVMAIVSYCIRVLPLTLIRREIKNRFIRSFLTYVPYAVLSAMTVPAIFHSTGSLISATAGFVVALVLSLFERSLITVAFFSCLAVFVVSLF